MPDFGLGSRNPSSRNRRASYFPCPAWSIFQRTSEVGTRSTCLRQDLAKAVRDNFRLTWTESPHANNQPLRVGVQCLILRSFGPSPVMSSQRDAGVSVPQLLRNLFRFQPDLVEIPLDCEMWQVIGDLGN